MKHPKTQPKSSGFSIMFVVLLLLEPGWSLTCFKAYIEESFRS